MLPCQLRIFYTDLWVNVLFEHRETDKRLRSESSMTAFISENIIVTDSTRVRHRTVNGEGKDTELHTEIFVMKTNQMHYIP
jgi:hypothetical protein